jgi:hypothetical protein
MRKLLITLMVLVFAGLAYAGTGDFEAGKDNADYHLPKYVNSYTKDKIITLTINSAYAADSALPGSGKQIAWVAPMACEIMAAYLITSDSVVAADTVTNFFECQIFTNDRATVDTALYYAGTGEATRLQPLEDQAFTRTATTSKQKLDKGEVMTVVWEDNGTPVSSPIDLKVVILLRPKSYPVTADFTTR